MNSSRGRAVAGASSNQVPLMASIAGDAVRTARIGARDLEQLRIQDGLAVEAQESITVSSVASG
jgi:hypothetical protein